MLNKGLQTRNKILREAMKFSSKYGLYNITIGEISKLSQLSRTGVISHFKNKEDMQRAILEYSEEEFVQQVGKKSYHTNSLIHLKNYFKNWANWVDRLEFETKASCPFIKAAVEYQDRENCPIRELIKDQQHRLLQHLTKLAQKCIDDGHFKSSISPSDFSYEAYSLYLGHNISKNLLDKAFADRQLKKAMNELISNSLGNKSHEE